MAQRSCPITGDIVEITESPERVVVEHPKHGRYVLNTDALPALSADAEARARIARWLEETSSLGIEFPNLAVEHVDLFGRFAGLEAHISEWHRLRQAIQPEDEERLWRKLKLEWNYNSNHIEGNTLTYHETELLLLYDRVAGGHPMRDYEEMKAHNVAIDHAHQVANSEQVLGEGRRKRPEQDPSQGAVLPRRGDVRRPAYTETYRSGPIQDTAQSRSNGYR